MSDPWVELEIKVAFLEHLVADLDQLVRQQADHIARLEREVGELRGEVRGSVAPAAVREGLEAERPPHHDRW